MHPHLSDFTLRPEDFQICSAFVLGDSLSRCLFVREGGDGERGGLQTAGGWGNVLRTQVKKCTYRRDRKTSINILSVLIY